VSECELVYVPMFSQLHTGALQQHQDYGGLGSDAVWVEKNPRFHRKISPPSSGLKQETRGSRLRAELEN
jgi:hypothetical protein